MNYFGHAAVASWTADEPARQARMILGSMLPDFATMCDDKIDGSDDADVARGIDLHHTSDSVFHQLPVVTGLMRDLDALLAAGNCARGPRRAVAHIGVELLLDGVLVREPGYRAAYLAAIAAGDAQAAALRWRDPETSSRFALLLERLTHHGVPDDLRRPEAITRRLARILAPRPRLAPSTDDLRAIRAALIAFAPRIEVACEAVLRGMRAGLDS